jgi:hypothetical protein
MPVSSTGLPAAVTDRRTSSSRLACTAGRRPAAPQHRAHPQRELAREERPRDDVVRSRLEREDAIHVRAGAREHENGHVLRSRRLANRAADREPRLIAQEGVDHHRARRLAAQDFARLRRGLRLQQLEAAALECSADFLPARGIGVDDENAHHVVMLSTVRLRPGEAMV